MAEIPAPCCPSTLFRNSVPCRIPRRNTASGTATVINIGIKSGTNSIHGTAYAFGRDASATDAANFIHRAGSLRQIWSSLARRRAGAILKDKLFWFASFEGVRDVKGKHNHRHRSDVPWRMTAAADPTNQLSMVDACNDWSSPAKTINPLSAQLAGLNPDDLCGDAANVHPRLRTFSRIITSTTINTFLQTGLSNSAAQQRNLQGRLRPQRPSPFERLCSTYPSLSPITSALPNCCRNTGPPVLNNAQQYSGDWTWTPNSTLVNDFRLGYVFIRNQTLRRREPDSVESLAATATACHGRNQSALWRVAGDHVQQLHQASWGRNARTSSGGPQGDVDLGGQRLVLARQALRSSSASSTWTSSITTSTTPNATGTAVFSTLAEFPAGHRQQWIDCLGQSCNHYARSNWYAGFAQDDWRIKSRVTLNLGLRYEIYTPAKERKQLYRQLQSQCEPRDDSGD